jgi:halogenation protein CepH
MLPLFKSSVVRQAMREGSQVQARAVLGEDAEAELPLFDGGLVCSADGMFWSGAG